MGLFGTDITSSQSFSSSLDESQSYSLADQSSGDQAGARLTVAQAQGAEFNISADPLSIDLAKEIAGQAFAATAQLGSAAVSTARDAQDRAFDLAGKATETDTQKVFSGFKMLLWPLALIALLAFGAYKGWFK